MEKRSKSMQKGKEIQGKKFFFFLSPTLFITTTTAAAVTAIEIGFIFFLLPKSPHHRLALRLAACDL